MNISTDANMNVNSIYKKNIEVFTDGSLRKEKNGDVCGYGIYFPNRELKNVAAPFTIEPLTNNRAELYAIYRAIRKIEKYFVFNKIIINTDSEYSKNSLTIWIHKWKKNNWINSKKKPVKNKDLIQKIDSLMQKYPNKIIVQWVRAHAGTKGNEEADRLANKGSDIYKKKYLKKIIN